MRKIFLSILTFVCLGAGTCLALEFWGDVEMFRQENPDGEKYEFSRDYIESLKYVYDHEMRRKDFSELVSDDRNKERVKLEEYVNALIKSNVDLRVAENYIKKHVQSTNGLMRKTADSFVNVCRLLIANNNKERKLMQEWLEIHRKEKLSGFNRDQFVRDLDAIVAERKEIFKTLIEASALAAKILISPKTDRFGSLYVLGITQEQRQKLIERIGFFKGEDYQGEMREGQSFFGASIAVLKEALQDETWGVLSK